MKLLLFRQAMILTSLLHKSATTDQISANSVATFKLEPLMLNILETEKIGSMAAPQ